MTFWVNVEDFWRTSSFQRISCRKQTLNFRVKSKIKVERRVPFRLDGQDEFQRSSTGNFLLCLGQRWLKPHVLLESAAQLERMSLPVTQHKGQCTRAQTPSAGWEGEKHETAILTPCQGFRNHTSTPSFFLFLCGIITSLFHGTFLIFPYILPANTMKTLELNKKSGPWSWRWVPYSCSGIWKHWVTTLLTVASWPTRNAVSWLPSV